MSVFALIVAAFYFALPAYFANMAPVIFDKLRFLKNFNRPIDGGRKMNGHDLFGRHKTWRGLMAAVVFSLLICFIQSWLFGFEYFRLISSFDYRRWWMMTVFGVLAGLGAILGDLGKSFLKRRLGIAAGKSWPVFDQLDFIAGFFLFTFWLVWPGWPLFLMVFLLTAILHPLTNVVSYLFKIKKVWW